MAAYNMGYGGLSRAIRKFNTNDFWELSRYESGIPWETALYVPKIFAVAIVMTNPRAFGIHDVQPNPPASFDMVQVQPGVPLDHVARAAECSAKTIAELNPYFLAARIPPNRPGEATRRWRVRVPPGKGRSVAEQLSKQDEGIDHTLEPYLVRSGETCGALAQVRGITEPELRRINGMSNGEPLASGTVLLLPKRAAAVAKDTAPPPEVTVVPPRQFSYRNRQRVFYRVGSGDTLGKVATLLGVTRSELTTWNALDITARLHTGMVLQVYVDEKMPLDKVRIIKESETRVLVAGTQAFFDYFEGLNGKKRIVVAAKAGDSLKSIGKHYGMTVGQMERVNRRSRSDKLRPGEQIVVYAPRHMPGNAAEPDELEMAPLPAPRAPRPELLPGTRSGGDEAVSDADL
jgi:membrane-bound lytic murein transglycosylase D